MKNIDKLLSKIEKDCLKLKAKKQLHEYGQGQLDLIKLIREKINLDKYSVNDLKNYPDKSRLAIVGLMIANELHTLNSILEERK